VTSLITHHSPLTNYLCVLSAFSALSAVMKKIKNQIHSYCLSNYETDSLTFHRKGATGRWSTGALEHWGIGALERHLSNDWFFSSSMKKNPKCSLSTFPQRSSAPVRSPRLCGYSERNKTKFIVTYQNCQTLQHKSQTNPIRRSLENHSCFIRLSQEQTSHLLSRLIAW